MAPGVPNMLYRDLQTGHIAYFINWYAALMIVAFGFMVFAGAVLTGNAAAVALVPTEWFLHEQSKSSSVSAALDVLEHGFGMCVTLLFRSGLVLCAGIIVMHFIGGLFKKKRS